MNPKSTYIIIQEGSNYAILNFNDMFLALHTLLCVHFNDQMPELTEAMNVTRPVGRRIFFLILFFFCSLGEVDRIFLFPFIFATISVTTEDVIRYVNV